MDLGLKGRTAVVLAASKGMGRATAMALAAEGANVAICSRNGGPLEAPAEEIRKKTGAAILSQTADVTKDADRRGFLNAVLDRFKAIDILITNGGGPPSGAGLSLEDEDYVRAVEATLLSAIRWTRAVAPGMIERKWGRILHIESSSVRQPIDGLILSNTMRAGVAGFAKTMSRELAPYGVLVNVLCPGSMRTDRLTESVESRARDRGVPVKEFWRKVEAEIPLGRVASPEEFAAAAAFLSSEKASYITGAVIPVDGGLCRGLL